MHNLTQVILWLILEAMTWHKPRYEYRKDKQKYVKSNLILFYKAKVTNNNN